MNFCWFQNFGAKTALEGTSLPNDFKLEIFPSTYFHFHFDGFSLQIFMPIRNLDQKLKARGLKYEDVGGREIYIWASTWKSGSGGDRGSGCGWAFDELKEGKDGDATTLVSSFSRSATFDLRPMIHRLSISRFLKLTN